MTPFHTLLAELAQRDGRFACEAYEFIYQALDHTSGLLQGGAAPSANSEEAPHVTPRELLEGIRTLALQKFGLMAATVFRRWGLRTSADFGAVAHNLVDAGLLTLGDGDSLADFQGGFSFDEDLTAGFQIPLDEAR